MKVRYGGMTPLFIMFSGEVWCVCERVREVGRRMSRIFGVAFSGGEFLVRLRKELCTGVEHTRRGGGDEG